MTARHAKPKLPLTKPGCYAKPKRGRPRIGDPPPAKPWLDLGMSERTWYRRQAEERRK